MPEETTDFVNSLLSDFNTKLRDIEERQTLLKERVLLIGKNLVELKDIIEQESVKRKTNTESVEEDLEKIKKTLVRITKELDDKTRKSETEILKKQLKMFQPFIK